MITGWTVQVNCPHGYAFRMPLRYLYGLDTSWVQTAGKVCAECAKVYGAVKEPRTFRQWLADRRVNKQFKRMTKGLRHD